jgi:hypothetical protein
LQIELEKQSSQMRERFANEIQVLETALMQKEAQPNK